MIPLNCLRGDVTGEELAACLVYQGAIYAPGRRTRGDVRPARCGRRMRPPKVFSAPICLRRCGAIPQLRRQRGRTFRPAELFEISGCQEWRVRPRTWSPRLARHGRRRCPQRAARVRNGAGGNYVSNVPMRLNKVVSGDSWLPAGDAFPAQGGRFLGSEADILTDLQGDRHALGTVDGLRQQCRRARPAGARVGGDGLCRSIEVDHAGST